MDAPVGDGVGDVEGRSGVGLPALCLCGGRGRRLDTSTEKPLVEVCGTPMLDRVTAALRASVTGQMYAVVSPHTSRTRARAAKLGLEIVETPGEGYVADLDDALDAVGRPALTVAADLPFLDPTHVDRATRAAVSGAEDERVGERAVASVAVCVPAALKRRLGVSVDDAFDHDGQEVAPTGLNVVGGVDGDETDRVVVWSDERLAVNVNRPGDREVAESLCDRD